MLTDNENPPSKSSDQHLLLKLLAILAWTGVCALVWFVWFASAVYDVNADRTIHDTDIALGAAGCVITGCTGGIWLVGLLVFTLFIVILRR